MNKQKFLKILKAFGKKKLQVNLKDVLIITTVFLSVVITAIVLFSISISTSTNNWEDISDEYYDPIDIILYNPDIQLVDIRQAEIYKEGYIKDAINIPADFEKGDIKNAQEILHSFSKLGDETQIVIYGENSYTLRTVAVARLLEQQNIQVKVLRVGWTEFFHFQTFWLPEELSSKVNILNYIELPE